MERASSHESNARRPVTGESLAWWRTGRGAASRERTKCRPPRLGFGSPGKIWRYATVVLQAGRGRTGGTAVSVPHPVVIKYGGSLLEDETHQAAFLQQI